LRDKRIETIPKKAEPEHHHATNPLKSVLRNSAGAKSKGGVALFYSTDDLTRYEPTVVREERPICACGTVQKRAIQEQRRTQSKSPARLDARRVYGQHLYHNKNDLAMFSCSPLKKQTGALHKFHERDTEIALKRREKLESVRNKDREPEANRRSYVHNFRNVESKVASAAKRDRQAKRYITHFKR